MTTETVTIAYKTVTVITTKPKKKKKISNNFELVPNAKY